MKKLFFLITLIFIFLMNICSPVYAEGEPTKVLSLNYDTSSSLVFITTKDTSSVDRNIVNYKYVPLANPNRIYFDINNAVLIGAKQQLLFDKSQVKEIKLAQFSTNPNVVRVVMTFEEDFDTSKVKINTIDGNYFVCLNKLTLSNNYFHPVYDEKTPDQKLSEINVNSQAVKKVEIPVSAVKVPQNVTEDINRAFEQTTLSNTKGATYDSVVSVDISSKLKLRNKYFINKFMPKNQGVLVNGVGQMTIAKVFYLSVPKRLVIDFPNTYVDKGLRNRELRICYDGSCKDTAKLGQFDKSNARIVITSEDAEKYIPICSQDSQSMLLVNSEKLNHTSLSKNVSNINKVYVKQLGNNTSEMIISFSAPVVYSLYRTTDTMNFYLFNVKSYNEQDIIKTLYNTGLKDFTFSLLPQTGVRGKIPNLNKNDIIKVEQSIDSKALKITYTRSQSETPAVARKVRKNTNKDKVVLDAGHGGSDYGAIREGINEKDITLDVTKKVESILRSKGYKVALTRDKDVYVSLEDRVNISESEEPEIFVSIHVNSAIATEPYGIETHYYHDYSKSLAETVHKNLAKEIETKNRGLFKSKFYVINHTTDPAILVEIGFLSNEAERNELITEKRKQKTAKAIANGIIEYLKDGKK